MKIDDLREKNLNDPLDSEHLNIARGFRKKFKVLYKLKFRKSFRQHNNPHDNTENWELFLAMFIDGNGHAYSYYGHIFNFTIPFQHISKQKKKEIIKKIKEEKKLAQRKLVEFGWIRKFEERIVK